jgi:hypothetical protein
MPKNILPSQLRQDILDTWLRLDAFDRDDSFRALTIDSRISCMRNDLPVARNKRERTDAILDQALDQGVLVSLLEVLRDRTSRGDFNYGQLDRLAQRAKNAGF